MTISIKIREDRVRRRLTKAGFRLNKTPARSWLRYYGPGYMILDHRNNVVSGCRDRQYQNTLEDVEAFAASHAEPPVRRTATHI